PTALLPGSGGGRSPDSTDTGARVSDAVLAPAITAATTAALLGGSQALEVLRSLINHWSPVVRKTVALAAGCVEGREVVDILIDVLKSGGTLGDQTVQEQKEANTDPKSRLDALRKHAGACFHSSRSVITSGGGSRVVTYSEWLRSDIPSQVFEALSRLGSSPERADAFSRIAESRDSAQQCCLIRELIRQDARDDDARDFLQRLLADGEPEAKEEARHAHERLFGIDPKRIEIALAKEDVEELKRILESIATMKSSVNLGILARIAEESSPYCRESLCEGLLKTASVLREVDPDGWKQMSDEIARLITAVVREDPRTRWPRVLHEDYDRGRKGVSFCISPAFIGPLFEYMQSVDEPDLDPNICLDDRYGRPPDPRLARTLRDEFKHWFHSLPLDTINGNEEEARQAVVWLLLFGNDERCPVRVPRETDWAPVLHRLKHLGLQDQRRDLERLLWQANIKGA
ncbi:MAG: hypothetical protein KAI66_02575, partial [Lentisphaeria bacterium]|nr:hypothetical protein [Lentisphaeria bacterium]